MYLWSITDEYCKQMVNDCLCYHADDSRWRDRRCGSAKYDESPLNPVYKLIEDEQYQEAISELTTMVEEDADVWNLLGFSNRKLKNYDQALKFYQKALALKPKHKGANEYLGELYLETGKLDRAKERLAVLDDACFFTCSEYRTLKKAIEKYQKNNPG